VRGAQCRLGVSGDVSLTSDRTLRLLPVQNVDNTVVAGHDLTLYSVGNLYISGGISAPNGVSVGSAADVKLSGTTLNLSTVEAIAIESDSSLSINGILESAKGISLISNHGDVEVIGAIRGRNGAPLESLTIIARGNLMKSGPFAGQFRFRSLVNDLTYYANTPELVVDSVVVDAASLSVANFGALDLVPFTTTDAPVMKDPVTGLDFFRDPTTGATPATQQRYLRYIGEQSEEFYRRTDPVTGLYPFSGLLKETHQVSSGPFAGLYRFQSFEAGPNYGKTYYSDTNEISISSVVKNDANQAVSSFLSLQLVAFNTRATQFIELYSSTEDPTQGILYATDGFTVIDPQTVSSLEGTLVRVNDQQIIDRLLPFTLKDARDGRPTGTSISLEGATIGTVSNSVTFIAQGQVRAPAFALNGSDSMVTVIGGENVVTGNWRAANINVQSTGLFDSSGSFIGGSITVPTSFRTTDGATPKLISLTALNDITFNAAVDARQGISLQAGRSLNNLPASINVSEEGGYIDLSSGEDLLVTGSLTAHGPISLVSTNNRGTGGEVVVHGDIDSGSGLITIQTSKTGSHIDGVIRGSGGLTLSGGGTLTLFGANTYSGTTNLIGSQLNVAGSIGVGSSVVVSSGSVLSGIGSIAGPVTIQPGGLLSPGNSPGRLATGSLTLTADATFLVEITGLLAVVPRSVTLETSMEASSATT